jgi:HlyD family secretion protein
MKKILIILIILCVAGGACYKFFYDSDNINIANHLEMTKTAKGNITKIVSSNGTIEPRNKVDVGTQVSGIIEKIYVDFNDEVKKGQLIATLDTYLLEEEVKETKSRLESAEKKLKIAKKNYQRNQDLFKEGYIAKTALEEYEIALAEAETGYNSALASYNKAKRNLSYAQITSPVDGTIIAKEVEVGQTVASSFSTPTLFSIAEDLTKMQIETSISEADIGMIKQGIPVTFTVDAYPADTFNGTIEQVRLNPNTESNVVIYTVIINIDNPDKKLLPGMTAFVDIKIAEVKDVLTLPKSTLQFKLPANLRDYLTELPPEGLKYHEAVVYKLQGNKVAPVVIETGLSNDSLVEVVKGLSAGEEVISEYTEKTVKKKSGSSRRPPM